MTSTSPIPQTPTPTPPDSDTYALIATPNITRIQFGTYSLKTWYGTSVYFSRSDHKILGIKASLKDRYKGKNKGSAGSMEVKNQELGNEEGYTAEATADETEHDSSWLDMLYVCDFCFKYTDILEEFQIHYEICCAAQKKYVFGKMCYRDKQHTIRRIRGSKHKLFCQNLSLFTKLYLDNKSVFFDVDYFTYYVIYDNYSLKPLGFFSKEQLSLERNNLACILVFPPYQRQHLGRKLIELSYELSKSQYLISGPEQPLSPFGLVGYLRYWSDVIGRLFIKGSGMLAKEQVVTIEMISQITGFRNEDVDMTLRYMEVLLRRDVCTEGETEDVFLDKGKLLNWIKVNISKKKHAPLIKKDCLLL